MTRGWRSAAPGDSGSGNSGSGNSGSEDTVLRRLRELRDAMLADLERLVTAESPSTDVPSLHRCADVLGAIGESLLGYPPERTEAAGRPVLRFGPPDAPVLLLGHLDTVHPAGTLARVPYRIAGGRAYGPGVLDMKVGLVQGLYALATAAPAEHAALLVTADEELGSPYSRAIIEEAANGASAILVLEASAAGKLKVARKGVSRYELELTGRAAHAGLDTGLNTEQGANACLGLAHAALLAGDLADAEAGTTVTPTLAAAGTSANTVPDSARLTLDVRAVTGAEQQRVDRALRALTEPLEGVRVTVSGGVNRPPMEGSAGTWLFERAREAAARLGLPELEADRVGGGSDGNFTAALGVPTLDGLGGVGAGAHTDREWVKVAAMPDRAALLAGLVAELVPAQPGAPYAAEAQRATGTEGGQRR